MSKSATIEISVKDPDAFGELIEALGLSPSKADNYFEFGEYADLEIEIDANLNIVGGKVLPR